LLTGSAHADLSRAPGGIRVSGGVRVSGGFSARVPSWSGGVRVYSARPYYYYQPYYRYYYPVPAYYGVGYSVDAGVAPGVTQVVAPPPALPRLGLGLFAGGLVTTNTASNGSSIETQGSDFGLLGRLRLTSGLLLEGDIGKTHAVTTTSVNGVDVKRVDRRLGASLVYEFGAHYRWSPYILGGLGAEQTDLGSTYSATRGYGEIGGGIRFAVTERFHLTADLRVGARDATTSSDTPVVLARTIYPAEPTNYDQPETYVRSRLSAILWF
jgi:hypothetical protein